MGLRQILGVENHADIQPVSEILFHCPPVKPLMKAWSELVVGWPVASNQKFDAGTNLGVVVKSDLWKPLGHIRKVQIARHVQRTNAVASSRTAFRSSASSSRSSCRWNSSRSVNRNLVRAIMAFRTGQSPFDPKTRDCRQPSRSQHSDTRCGQTDSAGQVRALPLQCLRASLTFPTSRSTTNRTTDVCDVLMTLAPTVKEHLTGTNHRPLALWGRLVGLAPMPLIGSNAVNWEHVPDQCQSCVISEALDGDDGSNHGPQRAQTSRPLPGLDPFALRPIPMFPTEIFSHPRVHGPGDPASRPPRGQRFHIPVRKSPWAPHISFGNFQSH